MYQDYPECVNKPLITKDVLTDYERVCINNTLKHKEQEELVKRSEVRRLEQERLEAEREALRVKFRNSPEGIKEAKKVNYICGQVFMSYLAKNPSYKVYKKYDGERQNSIYICNLVIHYETSLGNRYKEVNLIYNVRERRM
ncbi:hypothetical protein VCHA37P192_40414 [Vibrio chagasii]|nr:hypothetical protein VCHA37P192_40414 [Vibrio chagasii]